MGIKTEKRPMKTELKSKMEHRRATLDHVGLILRASCEAYAEVKRKGCQISRIARERVERVQRAYDRALVRWRVTAEAYYA